MGFKDPPFEAAAPVPTLMMKIFFFLQMNVNFVFFLSIYFRVQSSLKHFKFQNKVFVFKDICWDFIEFQFSIF